MGKLPGTVINYEITALNRLLLKKKKRKIGITTKSFEEIKITYIDWFNEDVRVVVEQLVPNSPEDAYCILKNWDLLIKANVISDNYLSDAEGELYLKSILDTVYENLEITQQKIHEKRKETLNDLLVEAILEEDDYSYYFNKEKITKWGWLYKNPLVMANFHPIKLLISFLFCLSLFRLSLYFMNHNITFLYLAIITGFIGLVSILLVFIRPFTLFRIRRYERLKGEEGKEMYTSLVDKYGSNINLAKKHRSEVKSKYRHLIDAACGKLNYNQ